MTGYKNFNAKLYFDFIIKNRIIPLLKEKEFKKSGNCFYRNFGEIFQQIKFIKSVYNQSNGCNFRLDIEMCPAEIKNIKVEINGSVCDWTWSEKSLRLNINDIISEERLEYKNQNHNWNGWYLFYRNEDISEKVYNEELKIDLTEYILPLFDEINTNELLNLCKSAKSALSACKKK